jgi:uncharacterized protein
MLAMDDEPQPAVAIGYEVLSKEALQGVIEAFILREGTDYGMKEYSLEQKVAHVLEQLKRGTARIVFDPNSESVDIVVNPAQACGRD